ncbi:DUF6455 family protein [Methylobacterium sp. WSM2598]|uniref:DUF6455 family protein n=1 Tax=Methylobacterium sp. WSM2598 TaxID=398261 RepID=UPI0003797ECC|nr:DUF6455 family protein [Methylobacterium sp. WSM2598]
MSAHATRDLAGPCDWMLAPLSAWAGLFTAAQEIRAVDDECLRVMLEERLAPPAAADGTGPALGLVPLMHALGLDPEAVGRTAPATMATLERACAGCGQGSRCERDLAAGLAAVAHSDYCPNAARLAALVEAARAA